MDTIYIYVSVYFETDQVLNVVLVGWIWAADYHLRIPMLKFVNRIVVSGQLRSSVVEHFPIKQEIQGSIPSFVGMRFFFLQDLKHKNSLILIYVVHIMTCDYQTMQAINFQVLL